METTLPYADLFIALRWTAIEFPCRQLLTPTTGAPSCGFGCQMEEQEVDWHKLWHRR